MEPLRGPRDRRGAFPHSRRLTRLMDKPLWGLRVLKFDGAIAPRVLRFDAPPARGLLWAPYIYRRHPLMDKTFTTGLSPVGNQANLASLEEMHSPFGGWRHHLARWEACHWIRGSRGSPMNPVPLPPPQAGALWMLSHVAMSLQESIERFILSPGWGKVRRSWIRGSRAAANH